MAGFKQVVRNSSYLLGSRMLSRVLSMAFFIYAASRLGPELFGSLAFVLVSVELASAIGDLGLTRYGARELVRHWEKRSILAGEILTLQVLASIVLCIMGLAAILVWQPAYPKTEMLLMGLVAVFLSSLVNTAETLFIASENFLYSALLSFFGRSIFVVFGVVVLAAASDSSAVIMIMWGFVLAVVVESILRTLAVFRKVTVPSFRFTSGRLKKMLMATAPFAAAAMANIVFLRVNVMILELFEGNVAVGIYSVAFTLFSPFVWVPLVMSRALLPGLTAIYAHDVAAARNNVWQWYRLMALAGIPIALSVTMLAVPVLSFFPAGYAESSTVLQILIWAIPVMLLISIGFNALQIIGREKVVARIMVVGALATTAYNFIFIPVMGTKGAAVALLAGAMTIEIQNYFEINRHLLRRHAIRLFARPLLAGTIMGGVAYSLHSYNPWVGTVAGMAAYLAVILLCGGVRISEIRTLIRS